jgi:UDP-3-O-[3-hydroxymyristoyl] N-acetylglucosamine deacetylase
MGTGRRSLGKPVELAGLGVRSGRRLRVALLPAPGGSGLRLERTDTAEAWPLDLSAAFAAPGASAVGSAASSVIYVEHLLAAFAATGVTDATVRVDGPELPLLDGSALPWVNLLAQAGVVATAGESAPLVVTEPVVRCAGETFLSALPAAEAEFVYVLDHPHPLVGRQWARFRPATDNFTADLAPARTFTTEAEARGAREQGLLRAGSEENALVIYPDRLSAPPTLPHAFARHKLLDLLGDLYLLGRPLQARVVAYQSGHRLNHQLAAALRSQADSA